MQTKATIGSHTKSTRMATVKKTVTTTISREIEKLNPHTLLLGLDYNSTNTMETGNSSKF